MKKWYLPLILTMGLFTGCLKDKKADKETIVEMTIYPEIGYGAAIMSQTLTEVLLFSESSEKSKQQLVNIIAEGFDFNYERGYKYTFKVKKIWMSDPPQDVSSVKYVFIGPLNKEKVITEDSESIITVTVQPNFVSFYPRFSKKHDPDDHKTYDALLCKESTGNSILALLEIEGFDYEEGYQYELRVKKMITADPYSERFVLVEMLSKQKE